jgi:hypothetical protein
MRNWCIWHDPCTSQSQSSSRESSRIRSHPDWRPATMDSWEVPGVFTTVQEVRVISEMRSSTRRKSIIERSKGILTIVESVLWRYLLKFSRKYFVVMRRRSFPRFYMGLCRTYRRTQLIISAKRRTAFRQCPLYQRRIIRGLISWFEILIELSRQIWLILTVIYSRHIKYR